MNRLPLLVIGGYLGAGKTTMIKHLLSHSGGLRLLVLVNDFGSINIDADLIASQDGDTIALSNGCVCCAMTGDLFYAIGDALDRNPRPDLVIVEASGVADPARIAAIALAEPELEYTGIVTVVDTMTACDLLDDDQIAAQIKGQIAAADLIAMSKPDCGDPVAVEKRLASISRAMIVSSLHGAIDLSFVTGLQPRRDIEPRHADHAAAYASSKAAIRNHTKSVALYCAGQGLRVRCNSIHPAAVMTPMWEPMLGNGPDREERAAAMVADTPLQRFGEPEEVAALAVLLASDEAAYMTGAELTIDGGILAGSAATPQE